MKTGPQPQPEALRNRPAPEDTRQADESTSEESSFDNRPEFLAQRKLADAISNSSPMVAQRKQLEAFGKATTSPVQLAGENQIMKEQMAARVTKDRASKATQDQVGKKIQDSREGFGVRKIEGVNESTKLMNPAIKAGSSVDDVLTMVNAKGGPQEEYAAIMDKFKDVKGVEKVIVAPPKNKESTERKIKDDYSGAKDKEAGTAGIERMVDLVRGSIVVTDIEDLPAAYEAIKAAFTTRSKDDAEEIVGLVKVKNNFAAAEKIFNRDMNITVELPVSKMYCEIQIHVKAFEANKNRKKEADKSLIKDDNDRKGWAFHGHIYYEASRVIKVEKGKPPEGVEAAKEILLHAEKSDEMSKRDDDAFKKLTPAQTILKEVDDQVNRIPDLKPEDRERQWAEAFKNILMEHQAQQSQSLLLAAVMKSGLPK